VDGVDDLGGIDALQVGARDPEVGVPELTLNDRQWDPLACHFDGVGVPELMGGEKPPHTSDFGEASKLGPRARL
jgi:hypothetical protein